MRVDSIKKMIRENPEGFECWTKSRRARNYLRIFRDENSGVLVAIFAHSASFRAGRNITATLFAQNGKKERKKDFEDPDKYGDLEPKKLFKAIPKDFASGKIMKKIKGFISDSSKAIR